jgi:hypothetical protein
MVNTIRTGILAGLLGLAITACTGINGPEDQALEISLTASPATAVVGSPITFRFEARGNSLEGVALRYGDGAVDSIPTYQARTASGVYNHGYTDAGVYMAVVTVLASGGAIAIDSVSVSITAGAGRPAVLTSRASRVN